MPSARCSPVPLSPICAPVTSGTPSRKPVVDAAPPVHCATFSYTLQSSYGPGPKPLIEATIIFGLRLWIFSQGKPMRSSTPGPKFSTSTSQLFISAVSTSLPFGFLVSSVIERLLWFSMVKYRLSTFGMSCNCPRVMSPTPGRSTLITSAPNQASNCVQVGPDWTWVKSRMRTPFSALVIGLAPLNPDPHARYDSGAWSLLFPGRSAARSGALQNRDRYELRALCDPGSAV